MATRFSSVIRKLREVLYLSLISFFVVRSDFLHLSLVYKGTALVELIVSFPRKQWLTSLLHVQIKEQRVLKNGVLKVWIRNCPFFSNILQSIFSWNWVFQSMLRFGFRPYSLFEILMNPGRDIFLIILENWHNGMLCKYKAPTEKMRKLLHSTCNVILLRETMGYLLSWFTHDRIWLTHDIIVYTHNIMALIHDRKGWNMCMINVLSI